MDDSFLIRSFRKYANEGERSAQQQYIINHFNESDAELYHRLGQIKMDRSNYSGAIESYKKAIDCNRENFSPTLSLLSALRQSRQYDDADHHLQELIEPNHPTQDWTITKELLLNHIAQKKWSECHTILDNASKKYPNHNEICLCRGYVCYKENNIIDAIKHLQESVEIDGSDYRPYLNLSIIMFESNKHEDALKYLEVLRKDFDSSLIWKIDFYASFIFSTQCQWDKSLWLLDSALATSPDNVEVITQSGIIYFEKKFYSKAIDCFQKAIDLDKYFIEPYLCLATTYADIQQYDEASNILDIADSVGIQNCERKTIQTRTLLFQAKKQWQKALCQIDKGIEKHPDEIEFFYQKGLILFYLKQCNKAIKCFKKCIDLDNLYFDAHFSLIETYRELQHHDDAKVWINNLEKINASDIEWRVLQEKAFSCQARNQWQEALNFLIEAVKAAPYKAELFQHMGHINIQMKRYEEARNCFEKAINCNAFFLDSYWSTFAILRETGDVDAGDVLMSQIKNLGLEHHDWRICHEYALDSLVQNDYQNAIVKASEAIQLFPNNAFLHWQLGIIHSQKKDFPAATQCFEIAIKIDPNFLDPYFNLMANYREIYDFKMSSFWLDAVQKLKLESIDWWIDLEKGLVNLKQRKHEDAIKFLLSSINFNPFNANLHIQLGLAFNAKADFSMATQCFEKAIEVDLFSIDSYLFHALANCSLCQFEKAEEVLKNFAKLGIPWLGWKEDLICALILKQRGEYVACADQLRQSITSYPDKSELHFHLGLVYLTLKDDKKGIQCLEKTIEIDRYFLDAYFSLHSIMRDSGNYKAAHRYLDKLNDLNIPSYNWLISRERASVYYQENKQKPAEEELLGIMEQYSSSPFIVNETGESFLNYKDYHNSLSCYCATLEADLSFRFNEQ